MYGVTIALFRQRRGHREEMNIANEEPRDMPTYQDALDFISTRLNEVNDEARQYGHETWQLGGAHVVRMAETLNDVASGHVQASTVRNLLQGIGIKTQ